MKKQNFQTLVNASKRIHHTEQSRTEILDDLKVITEKEYDELSDCFLIDKHSAELVAEIIHQEIQMQKLHYEATCFENDHRQMPHPLPPTELMNQLEELRKLFTKP